MSFMNIFFQYGEIPKPNYNSIDILDIESEPNEVFLNCLLFFSFIIHNKVSNEFYEMLHV